MVEKCHYGDDGTSQCPANEQMRKTAPVLDYTVSCRATNPALVMHLALRADLLSNGQMPVTHFPANIICCLWCWWFHPGKKQTNK